METRYRITTRRFDERSSIYSNPVTKGESLEDCDAKAKTHFNGVCADPANKHDFMSLYRFDRPAPSQEKTFLLKNGEPSGDDCFDIVG